MVVASINGIKMHVFQHVMHPAHIPFEGKAKSTDIGWTCNERPCRRLFSNRDRARFFTIDGFIELTQEIDCFQMLSPSILIRNPFSWFTHVIEIEHGGNSINTQPINVIFMQPEERIGE